MSLIKRAAKYKTLRWEQTKYNMQMETDGRYRVSRMPHLSLETIGAFL